MARNSILALGLAALLLAGCAAGTLGTRSTARYDLIWKGEFSAPPADAKPGWAYYDRELSAAYFWDGGAWAIIAQDGTAGAAGANGTNGTGILWQGSFASAPAGPQVNFAYYNTTDRASYIWNGAAWDVIAHDIRPGMVRRGTKAHGDYLALAHNLATGNLTFTAQVLKNGSFYDVGAYIDRFQQDLFRKGKTLVTAHPVINMVAARNAAGRVMVAYADTTDVNYGYFVIYDRNGALVKAATKFTTIGVYYYLSVCALENGSFVLAYRNDNSPNQGFFRIYDGSGNPLIGTDPGVDFSTGQAVNFVTVAGLLDGSSDFVVCYTKDAGVQGYFQCFTSIGVQTVQGETTFESVAGAREKKAVALTGGGFMIAYRMDEPDYGSLGRFRIYNSGGTWLESTNTSLVPVLESCDAVWNELSVGGVTPNQDTGQKKAGTASVRFDTVGIGAGVLLGSQAITAQSLTGYNYVSFYLRSTLSIKPGDLEIELDQHPACASPEFSFLLNRDVSADTWTKVFIPLPIRSLNTLGSIVSIGVKQVTDKIDMSLYLDDFRKVKNAFDPWISGSDPAFLSPILLADGKVLISEMTSENAGRFTVIDPVTAGLASQRTFCANSMNYNSVCQLDNGTIVTASSDATFTQGDLLLTDSTSQIPLRTAIFDSNTVAYPWIIPTVNREYLLFYKDEDLCTYFVKGGDYSLYLKKMDDNEVRIYNYSGETLELLLSLDQ